MKQEPKARLSMRDFLGQQSNLDTLDMPPGATVLQRNVKCVRPGELRVRGGLRDVSFEQDE